MKWTLPVLALVAVCTLTACGGSGAPAIPTIGAARTFSIADFEPAGKIEPGTPVKVSFQIRQPDGTPLTRFKTGAGPHTGVHLIFVRQDLATIIHHHPALHGQPTITDTVTFPLPGRYRFVLDVYPASGQTNFQLFRWVTVAGAYHAETLPPPSSSTTVDGYHFTLTGASHLEAVQAQDVTVHVTAPDGSLPTFEPWFGALAHAIFFRKGSLDYFHTHVCAANVSGCTSVLGGEKVTGRATKPGVLDVGVLVPLSGTWRLFLQCQVDGRVLTAPFTLDVR